MTPTDGPGPDALAPALRPRIPSPLQPVADRHFDASGVRLLLKRDDLIHPEVPGNKWRKLAPNLSAARSAGADTLVTFGGAYSNHLRATAAAGRLLGFATVGIVRGEELADGPLNDSLARCAADGMLLRFVDRASYRRKAEPEVLAALVADALSGTGRGPESAYVVPEGGSNAEAVRGCAELGRELRDAADVVAVACGTGGTLAGLAAGLGPRQRALGVAVLRGGFLEGEVRAFQTAAFGGPRGSWRVDDRFHGGGFARSGPELAAFAARFEHDHGLPLERVYVAKLLHGLTAMADAGEFAPGTTVAAVVTGPADAPAP
ncbi:1-aminocyclopropane-1-carboxylate deaminase/D-cysteine desulfhydrase [Streptomyces fuscigenes]|uniref:1-aminocyclopropane-1-carboxylate deaminase/D-cysteine desulfhydrase n=1 Tax=Streptomyces fuscigenes TaxID=1528880 RepID=UPI001F1C5AD8|nr:pyridoxal-phosphate dependent enzyme [Streptomyces fuscigenes]MCF3964483.1 pyridoxal-phosphate dependent enzyme [Streptomyces fuscigenes]